MSIICIERALVAVTNLDAACERWSKAGFAIAAEHAIASGIRCARMAAGAVEIDLCAIDGSAPAAFDAALARGGGAIGWTWGAVDDESTHSGDNAPILPALEQFLPGTWAGTIPAASDAVRRRDDLLRLCGPNRNTADYLEHIVVMTPSLDDAIAAHEKLGVPCKRIREAGGGMRQAFFKLEQTVLEVVGPARGAPQVWGFAFMCKDIARAVDTARASGLQATEPKTAIQGGRIARIVDPLDGVAIAYMEAPSASS